ncbi:hypothetical protein ONZ45_g19708 [Pleurotus djamor]|nr:hypothetical protein ONZ45_g19708 [Pleurotus djamor]
MVGKDVEEQGRDKSVPDDWEYSRTISKKVVLRLQPGGWLNDELINVLIKAEGETTDVLYIEPVIWRDMVEKLSKASDENREAQWSSVFLNQHGVERYPLERLISVKRIMVPLNCDNHWVLLTCCTSSGELNVLDSYARELGDAKDRLEGQIDWLREFMLRLKRRQPSLSWSSRYAYRTPELNVPQQSNGNDCGVFVILFARYLMKHPSLEGVDSGMTSGGVNHYRWEYASFFFPELRVPM